MDQDRAIEAFGALAQISRMAIYKLLVQSGPDGLQVGQISRTLNIVPSTLSGHLAILKRAGLLKAKRQQREIHYSADLNTMNALVGFMLADCCNGQAENCSEILHLLDVD